LELSNSNFQHPVMHATAEQYHVRRRKSHQVPVMRHGLLLWHARPMYLPTNHGKSQKTVLESLMQKNMHPPHPFPLAVRLSYRLWQSAQRAGAGKRRLKGNPARLPMDRPHGPHRLRLSL
jgi:hypothetical protein